MSSKDQLSKSKRQNYNQSQNNSQRDIFNDSDERYGSNQIPSYQSQVSRTHPIMYTSKSDLFDILYSEEGDGEILVEFLKKEQEIQLVTCVDISTLYKEKRQKAIEIAQQFVKLQHPNLLCITQEIQLLNNQGTLIFQTETPDHIAGWKSYCKKKFTTDEMLSIFRQLCEALAYLHSQGLIHRDVHPTRIHSSFGATKFNMIGMPYNYKKLLKKENFCGHVNYSAPELILEKQQFTPKVDIWSLGCCLYYLCTKKDPFEGRSPQDIKANIMSGRLEKYQSKIDPVLKTIIDKCLEKVESKRLTADQMLQFQDELELKMYGEIRSTQYLIQAKKYYLMQRDLRKSLSQSANFTSKYKNPTFFINARISKEDLLSLSMEQQQSSSQGGQNRTYESSYYQEDDSYEATQKTQYSPHKPTDQESLQQFARNSVKRNFKNNLAALQNSNVSINTSSINQEGGGKSGGLRRESQAFVPKQSLTQPQQIQIHECKDPREQFGLTSLNLDKFNSQFKTELIDENSPIKEQEPLEEEVEEKKVDNSQEQENAEQQCSFSIFNTETLFPDQTNISGYSNSDLKDNFSQGEPNSDESRNDNNKEEIEGIVASILQSSKRVRNQVNYSDGTKFVGEVQRHGRGIFYDQDGSIYDGMWYEDQKCGRGKILYPDGSVYDGMWENDKIHGKGVFLSSNGDRYDGMFSLGLKDGYGQMYYKNGNTYEGQFRNDILWGKGLFHFKNGNFYDGQFANGQFEGQGLMHFQGVGTYTGSFFGGNMAGIGKFDYLDGSVYDGDWKENRKHGRGKLIESDKASVYNGDWENNQKHGRGSFMQKGNFLIEGIWDKGNLVEMTKFQNYSQ